MTYRPRRAPRHEERTIRGLPHRLTWWGEPAGPPLILLHGWMDTSESWQFVVDQLPDTWTCVAPDWRGFGGSGRSPGGYWFPDYYADLEVLLDQLSPGLPARVVGHSMGGNIAAMYAGIRPQRLAWLINLEGMGMRRAPADRAPAQYEKWLDQLKAPVRQRPYKSYDELTDVIQARNPRLTLDRARFIARAWSRETPAGIELAADPAHKLVSPTLYRREEAEACWRRIEIPVLMVLGELSEHRGLLGADCTEEYFRSVYRNIEVVTIPGAGHMMHHEEPEAVARHIAAFARARESSV
jgi:pimeloyl-ACP methyl ester carboxylesterase